MHQLHRWGLIHSSAPSHLEFHPYHYLKEQAAIVKPARHLTLIQTVNDAGNDPAHQ